MQKSRILAGIFAATLFFGQTSVFAETNYQPGYQPFYVEEASVVTYKKADSITITIPQTISGTIDKNGSIRQGYTISVAGSIAPLSTVCVRPVSPEITLTEQDSGLTASGTVRQDDYYWTSDDVAASLVRDGQIASDTLDVGEWNGSVTFAVQVLKDTLLDGYTKSLWSWSETDFYEEDMRDRCLEIDATNLYQCMTIPSVDDVEACQKLSRKVKYLKQHGISVYWANGDPSWATDISPVIEVVEKICAYNDAYPDARIYGIVTDIEPYCLSNWEEAKETLCKSWVEGHKTLYQKASSGSLYVRCAVTPDFYQALSEYNTVNDLIFNCCNSYAFMLYNRDYLVYHMDTILDNMKYYTFQKPVEIVSEIQGDAALTFPSVRSVRSAWKDVVKTYGCTSDKLSFSYFNYKDE